MELNFFLLPTQWSSTYLSFFILWDSDSEIKINFSLLIVHLSLAAYLKMNFCDAQLYSEMRNEIKKKLIEMYMREKHQRAVRELN